MTWRDAIKAVLREWITVQKKDVTKISKAAFDRPALLSKFFTGARRGLSFDEAEQVASALGRTLEDLFHEAAEKRETEHRAQQQAELLVQEAKHTGLKDRVMETLKYLVDPDFYEQLVKESQRLDDEQAVARRVDMPA